MPILAILASRASVELTELLCKNTDRSLYAAQARPIRPSGGSVREAPREQFAADLVIQPPEEKSSETASCRSKPRSAELQTPPTAGSPVLTF